MAAFDGNSMQTYNVMRLLLIILCGTSVVAFVPLAKFRPAPSISANSRFRIRAPSFVLFARSDDDEEEDDDDEEEDDIDLSDQDWRAFRAKLVMQKPEMPTAEAVQDDGDLDGIGSVFSTSTSTKEEDFMTSSSTMTPLDPSQWAYESGNVIEKGAVILGGVQQDYGFGLRQQYFHKAAILVLDHEESTFTKGIILNRPSDLTLDDDLNEGVKWRVWFGGDVQGLSSNMPEVVCLHSLKDQEAVDASISVMKDIQVSTVCYIWCFVYSFIVHCIHSTSLLCSGRRLRMPRNSYTKALRRRLIFGSFVVMLDGVLNSSWEN